MSQCESDEEKNLLQMSPATIARQLDNVLTTNAYLQDCFPKMTSKSMCLRYSNSKTFLLLYCLTFMDKTSYCMLSERF